MSEREWPEPDFDKEWDGPDSYVPCKLCGAPADEECREGCPMLQPTPWEDIAAAWERKPW